MESYENLLKDADFKRAIRDGNLCLFIGAGVSRNIKAPDWNGLASKITEFCRKNFIINHSCQMSLKRDNNPEKIISYCMQKIKEKLNSIDFSNKAVEKQFNEELYKILVEEPKKYYKNKLPNSQIFEDIIKIYETGKVLLIQTNYDDIIETATKKFIPRAYIPYLDKNITVLKNDMFVYLHGKLSKKDDIISPAQELVLSREMYNKVYVIQNEEYYEKQKAFFNHLLNKYYIIFLGYSLQDIEIVHLIANREPVKSSQKIAIIVDDCSAKNLDNQIQEEYLKKACNNQIAGCYSYDTELNGFGEFKNVISKLAETIINYKEDTSITNLEVNYDEY